MEQEPTDVISVQRIRTPLDFADDQITDELLLMAEFVADERDLRRRDLLDSLALEGQILDDQNLTEILNLSETLMDGQTHVPTALPLTRREYDVLRLLVTGMPNREIAEVLKITVNTVKTHLVSLYGKLDVHNRTEAVTAAQGQRLV